MKALFQRLVSALVLLLLIGASEARADAAADIAKANEQYRAENFREAVALYQSAVTAGTRNAALFYNLGNALFRAGETGRAILNYERALALNPNHPEARANLRLAQEKTHALEMQPEWWNQFIDRATPNQLAIGAAVAFWIAAFCFAGWLLASRRSAPILMLALLALIAGGVSLGGLYALESGPSGRALAVVTEEKIQARVATADNASSVLALPPGSEINILSTRGDWIYAALPNDLRGWIPTGGAEPVRF